VNAPARRVPFTGAVNFRDLGGYRTADGLTIAWRQLYRSDSLSDLTEEDLRRLRDLGLRTICDFRVESERRRKPNRLPTDHAIQVHSIPFIPRCARDLWQAVGTGSITAAEVHGHMLRHYQQFALDHTREYRRMFSLLLAGSAQPMLIHCASGKDRTGFAAALLLTALNVPWPVVLEDYVLSRQYRRALSDVLPDGIDDRAVEALQGVQPEYLSAAFAAIRQTWGNVDRYLSEGLGLFMPERTELQRRLLVSAA
jgi:protein-tyrosine phosphatase